MRRILQCIVQLINCISNNGQNKTIQHVNNYFALKLSFELNVENNVIGKDGKMFTKNTNNGWLDLNVMNYSKFIRFLIILYISFC